MRKETIIGVVAVSATLVGGYFGAIAPQSAATGRLVKEAQALESANAATAAQLPVLKSELSNISSQLDGLRSLSAKLPAALDQTDLYAELAAAAAQAGLPGNVQDITVTQPQLIAAAAPAAEGTDGGASTAGEGTPSEGVAPTDPKASPDAAAPKSVIASFEVSMTVKGTVGQTIAFLGALKEAERLSVVSSSNLTVDEEGVAQMQIRAKYFMQQVDVDGLVAQIEALVAAAGQAPGSVPVDPATDPAVQQPTDQIPPAPAPSTTPTP